MKEKSKGGEFYEENNVENNHSMPLSNFTTLFTEGSSAANVARRP